MELVVFSYCERKKKSLIPVAGFQRCEHVDLVFGGLTMHNLFLGYRRFGRTYCFFFKGFIVARVSFENNVVLDLKGMKKRTKS